MKKVQLQIRIHENLHKEVKLQCVKEGVTMADLLCRLVTEYLKTKKEIL